MGVERKIVYFSRPGPENTDDVLRITKTRAEELGINTIVVASTTGDTAVKATEIFQGARIVVVSHVAGFKEPNTQEFSEENKRKVESSGAVVFTATHAFSGLSKAMLKKFNTHLFEEVVAKYPADLGTGHEGSL